MEINFIDLHNDAITTLSPKRFSKYIKKAEKAGVKVILISIWTTEMENPLQRIQHYRQVIRSTKTSINLLLHIEDAWFINRQNIDELIKCKPYSVGLTWNANNDLAGGVNSDGKLTKFGKTIADKLITNNIIIDLAHLNKPSFYEVAHFANNKCQKLLCTHTCFDELNSHPRNLDRRQIQTIINSGGLIGLTLVGEFLSSSKCAKLSDIYKHISYFIKNFGEDNLAIGTDFFGTINVPKGLVRYKNFSSFRKYLIKKGLSNTTVDKIFFTNANNFFTK